MATHPPTGSTQDVEAEDPGRREVSSGRRGKGYFLPGFIALVALLVIGVIFVGAGDLQHPAATELSGSDIGSQIALSIQAQQNTSSPPTVTCPAREPVHQGRTFQCTLRANPDRAVYVTEVDGRGRIRWSFSPG